MAKQKQLWAFNKQGVSIKVNQPTNSKGKVIPFTTQTGALHQGVGFVGGYKKSR